MDTHPEHWIAHRIAELGSAPDIAVWTPLNSASGKWEARGKDWEIIEGSPSAFADKLCWRLGPASTAK